MGVELKYAVATQVLNCREQLLSITETKFDTRREFCEAAGVTEDMLSHVLKGRKDLSIGALEELLGKIGYGLTLVPIRKAMVGRFPYR